MAGVNDRLHVSSMGAAESARPTATPMRVDDLDRFVFIVGAPRCGTTTLSRFLKDHPSIAFPVIKEPHFFSQNDLRGLKTAELKQRVEADYLRRFFCPDANRRIGADGSVTYLYAPEQLEPILDMWPESRFVIALRDPLEMLPSLHRRLVYVGVENVPSFAKAWAASPDRASGRRLPRNCLDARLLRYDEAGRYSHYLKRLFAAVGRERCLVVLFDDLSADPAEQYRRLTDFSRLEPQSGVDLSPRRPGQSVRLQWLQRLLKQPPKIFREQLAQKALHEMRTSRDERSPSAPKGLMSLRKQLLRWNRVSRPSEALPLTLQWEIRRRFQDDIEELGSLLDRDLTHWLQPRLEDVRGEASRSDVRPVSSRRRPAAV